MFVGKCLNVWVGLLVLQNLLDNMCVTNYLTIMGITAFVQDFWGMWSMRLIHASESITALSHCNCIVIVSMFYEQAFQRLTEVIQGKIVGECFLYHITRDRPVRLKRIWLLSLIGTGLCCGKVSHAVVWERAGRVMPVKSVQTTCRISIPGNSSGETEDLPKKSLREKKMVVPESDPPSLNDLNLLRQFFEARLLLPDFHLFVSCCLKEILFPIFVWLCYCQFPTP